MLTDEEKQKYVERIIDSVDYLISWVGNDIEEFYDRRDKRVTHDLRRQYFQSN